MGLWTYESESQTYRERTCAGYACVEPTQTGVTKGGNPRAMTHDPWVMIIHVASSPFDSGSANLQPDRKYRSKAARSKGLPTPVLKEQIRSVRVRVTGSGLN
eukprot:357265-Chlamydomonas_euryale.AAC.5